MLKGFKDKKDSIDSTGKIYNESSEKANHILSSYEKKAMSIIGFLDKEE